MCGYLSIKSNECIIRSFYCLWRYLIDGFIVSQTGSSFVCVCVCMLILSSKSIHSAWMTYTFRFFSLCHFIASTFEQSIFHGTGSRVVCNIKNCAENSYVSHSLRFFTSFFSLQSKWLNLCLRPNFINNSWRFRFFFFFIPTKFTEICTMILYEI